MKLISSSLFLTILMIICEKENLVYSLPNGYGINSNKDLDDINLFSKNNTFIDHPKFQLFNTTSNFNNSSSNIKFNSSLISTISNIKNLQRSLEDKIRLFEKSAKEEKFLYSGLSSKIKKKKKENENALMFYNSLSLIMLAMLAGGLVGVIFILYFSFRKEE